MSHGVSRLRSASTAWPVVHKLAAAPFVLGKAPAWSAGAVSRNANKTRRNSSFWRSESGPVSESAYAQMAVVEQLIFSRPAYWDQNPLPGTKHSLRRNARVAARSVPVSRLITSCVVAAVGLRTMLRRRDEYSRAPHQFTFVDPTA
jgi:hypothetical protein